MKTFSAKPLEVKREWYVVDATNMVVGRLAAEIALRLRGKNMPIYTPHVDTGDYIVVINADKLVMTGNKPEDKKYFRHSGYQAASTKQLSVRCKKSIQAVLWKSLLKACFQKDHSDMQCSRSSSFMKATNIHIPPSNLNSSRSKDDWYLQLWYRTP